MNRAHSLVALLAVVPVIAACGSASSSPSATQTSSQGTPTVTANPAALVLHLPDLGYGYIAVAKETKKISLAEELKSDSAVSKPADRAGYRGGYTALFADANKGGVLSEALEYKNDSSAAAVYKDVTGLNRIAAQIHGTRIKIPAHAPGINQILVKGKTLVAGHMRTAYLISWRHGSVLSVLFTFGQNATQARLVALANHQDNRIAATGM